MIDLSTNLCGLQLSSPLVLASGIWGSCAESLVRVARAGAGAVTSKSCSLEARKGHPNPTVLAWEHGLINAVGLSNPGAAAQAETVIAAQRELAGSGVPLITSVFGGTPDAFAQTVDVLNSIEPQVIELNISCPNVSSEFGRPFASDPDEAAAVVRAVRGVYAGPLLVKLAGNTPEMVRVALATEAAGADGFTAINTLGPGMIIDVVAQKPVLSNKIGGVSGPAMLPIAVRCVYELARATRLPIIGLGGVCTGDDALQMVMAGAQLVGVGSALYYRGLAAFALILDEMRNSMSALGINSLDEIRGCAHD